MDIDIKKLNKVFENHPEVKLAYFFGSRAKDNAGPLSDYDFAVYLDKKDKKRIFEIKVDLINQITTVLKTDKVDVVVLNTSESPELKYNIIRDGKLIYQKEPFKITIEPKILNEYFDFRACLLKYNLINP